MWTAMSTSRRHEIEVYKDGKIVHKDSKIVHNMGGELTNRHQDAERTRSHCPLRPENAF